MLGTRNLISVSLSETDKNSAIIRLILVNWLHA